MNQLGNKIAEKRKSIGLTQADFAEKMHVTRQTVSRWEAGTVMPDIDKIGDIAGILGVSCDYLLKDDVSEEEEPTQTTAGISRLLKSLQGKKVKLAFFEDEWDVDLYNTSCTVVDFEGNWMKISADTKKKHIEKLIPVSSICSVELEKEAD